MEHIEQSAGYIQRQYSSDAIGVALNFFISMAKILITVIRDRKFYEREYC
jgi:hypothetical protein